MNLQENLLNIARNFDSNCESDILISDMIKECFKSLSASLKSTYTDADIISQFKKVNNTWNKVANILQDEDIYVIKNNGFKGFCLRNEEFKNVFKN